MTGARLVTDSRHKGAQKQRREKSNGLGRPRSLCPTDRLRAIALRRRGEPVKALAALFGVTRRTMSVELRCVRRPRPPPPPLPRSLRLLRSVPGNARLGLAERFWALWALADLLEHQGSCTREEWAAIERRERVRPRVDGDVTRAAAKQSQVRAAKLLKEHARLRLTSYHLPPPGDPDTVWLRVSWRGLKRWLIPALGEAEFVMERARRNQSRVQSRKK